MKKEAKVKCKILSIVQERNLTDNYIGIHWSKWKTLIDIAPGVSGMDKKYGKKRSSKQLSQQEFVNIFPNPLLHCWYLYITYTFLKPSSVSLIVFS